MWPLCRINELEAEARNEAVLQLLAPPLFRQVMGQPEVLQQLRRLPCIPTASGALSAPEGLFDSRNGQLAQALGSQAALPAEPFTSDQVLLAVYSVACCQDVCCWFI